MRYIRGMLVSGMMVLLVSCGGDTGGTGDSPPDTSSVQPPDSIIVMPKGPMEIALEFSNLLGMNDPACFHLLTPALLDSIPADSLSPQEIFGSWRAFDAGGRLTDITETAQGCRTSYHCTISRMELPAVNRIDFLLIDDSWLIDRIGVELPQEEEDSLTVQQIADLVLLYPEVRTEMRVARMLFEDCIIDSVNSYASLNAALESGSDFRDFILDLQPESYAEIARCNIRRAGKLQIIKDRADIRFIDVPADLTTLVNIWREMAFIWKSILKDRHEALQNLYSTGVWIEPDVEEDMTRLRGFRDFFLSVSDIVESRDSLSRTYRVILTMGNTEPLAQVVIDLDPHQLEQKFENQVGVPIWRALAVEMNGDHDPERVIYWAGNLFLFQGIPTGYRLVWRSFQGYDSDYHADFISQPSGRSGCREVTFTGNTGEYEYYLGYSDSGEPLFRRIRSTPDMNIDPEGQIQ